MTEENPTVVDVEATEVSEEPEPKISYQERKAFEEARNKHLKKLIKQYKRKMKSNLTIIQNLDQSK